MRSTIHLVTEADALALRSLSQVPIERSTLGVFGRRLHGVDREALVTAARALVDEEPLIASEMGRRRLAQQFPGHDPEALAQDARAWLPMVQVPPREVWGSSGRPLQAPLESWLGRRLDPMPVERLVARYLAALGPATVRDVQTWCGLTKLAEVVDAMRPQLMTFTDDEGGGRELFDLPDAPRPDPDTPAPVRYLYDYDNLLLSHADRSRFVYDVDYAAHGYGADSNQQPSSLLLDGFVAGTWTVTRDRGLAAPRVAGFRRLTVAEQEATPPRARP